MIQALIGPLTELAGGWLKGKADANAAAAQLKLTEAEAKALWKTYVEDEHDDDNRPTEYGTEKTSMIALTDIDTYWSIVNE